MNLKFEVTNQQLQLIKKKYVVRDSVNYLRCSFVFSEDWNGYTKTAIFTGSTGEPYGVILEEEQCLVPSEVIKDTFVVSVFGVNGDIRITTNVVNIDVKFSNFGKFEEATTPTPTIYEQILAFFEQLKSAFTSHEENKDNPHAVTKQQIGLGNVDNTADIDKPLSSAMIEELKLKADGAATSAALESLKEDSHIHNNFDTLSKITSEQMVNWDKAHEEKHTHNNKTVLDGISQDKISNWNDAYNDRHTHENSAVLDGITANKTKNWDTAYSNNHTHANSAVLAKITEDIVKNTHLHDNKTVLDQITEECFNSWEAAAEAISKKADETEVKALQTTIGEINELLESRLEGET